MDEAEFWCDTKVTAFVTLVDGLKEITHRKSGYATRFMVDYPKLSAHSLKEWAVIPLELLESAAKVRKKYPHAEVIANAKADPEFMRFMAAFRDVLNEEIMCRSALKTAIPELANLMGQRHPVDHVGIDALLKLESVLSHENYATSSLIEAIDTARHQARKFQTLFRTPPPLERVSAPTFQIGSVGSIGAITGGDNHGVLQGSTNIPADSDKKGSYFEKRPLLLAVLAPALFAVLVYFAWKTFGFNAADPAATHFHAASRPF